MPVIRFLFFHQNKNKIPSNHVHCCLRCNRSKRYLIPFWSVTSPAVRDKISWFIGKVKFLYLESKTYVLVSLCLPSKGLMIVYQRNYQMGSGKEYFTRGYILCLHKGFRFSFGGVYTEVCSFLCNSFTFSAPCFRGLWIPDHSLSWRESRILSLETRWTKIQNR